VVFHRTRSCRRLCTEPCASRSSLPHSRDPPSTWSVSQQSGTRVIPSRLREQRKKILMQMGLKPDGKDLQFAGDSARAVAFANCSGPCPEQFASRHSMCNGPMSCLLPMLGVVRSPRRDPLKVSYGNSSDRYWRPRDVLCLYGDCLLARSLTRSATNRASHR
jgi:hypothetical protein